MADEILQQDLQKLAQDLMQSVKDGIQTVDDAIKLTAGFSQETVKRLLNFLNDIKHLAEDIYKLICDALIAFHDLFR